MQELFLKGISICLLILPFGSVGQSDSTYDTGPSICDCVKNARKDPQLLSQCEQKYDYNLMSEYERRNFERKIKSCDDPEVCDCIKRAENDDYLRKVCDEKFRTGEMDEEELSTYNKDKELCDTNPQKPNLKTICECVNGDLSSADLEIKCKGIWNLSALNALERKEFVNEISACIVNRDNPDFTLTLCDCFDADDDDYKLKERCLNKFDIHEMSDSLIAELKTQTKDCNLEMSYVDEVAIACECLKQDPTLENLSPKCQAAMKQLEEKYMKAGPEEREEFIRRLMECFESLN